MKKTIFKIIFICMFLVLAGLFYNVASSPAGTEEIKVYFFDVGQGDAALIQKGYYQILIDGGPDDKVLSLLGDKMPLGDRTIEKIILTHPHADHLVGINEILKRYQIKTVVGSGVLSDTNQYFEFADELKKQNLNLEAPMIGQRDSDFANEEIEYFWPGDQYIGKKINNLNNSSEVFRFCYFSHCVFFTGDIEEDAQRQMILENKNNLSDFLSEIIKVPHHGSSNGLGDNILLKTVNPKKAVISVGKDNQFGHPHTSALNLLDSSQIMILRTDQDGTIEFKVSKNGFEKE